VQEWMGHRDFKTTLIYADYQPSGEEAGLVEKAFARDSVRDSELSETEVTSENLKSHNRAKSDPT
jgi:hypothetical protein